MKPKYHVEGEVYQVRERMLEDNGVHGEWDDEPDWYEYEVDLVNSKGQIVDSWDSLSETYDGIHKLTREEAKSAFQEVKDGVKAGNARDWFHRIPAEPAKPKYTAKSGKAIKRRKLSTNVGLGSMRG